MNKKEALIYYLNRQPKEGYTSAKKLAKLLGVTDRTIRNLVKNINDEVVDYIFSSKEGYKLNPQKSYLLTIHEEDSINNRRFYILRRLFKSTERGIDVFDLADSLYVSDATIRSDLAYINTLAKFHELTLTQKENRFFLNGSEKNKRSLMMALLREQNVNGSSFEEDIEKFLDNISLQKVTDIVQTIFKKYHLTPNTYFMQNFILHLAIAIDRGRSQTAVENSHYENSSLVSSSKQLGEKIVKEIDDQLFTLYEFHLTEQDKIELSLLSDIEVKQKDMDKDFIDDNVQQALAHALSEVANIYMISFDDKEFKTRLLYHVQNLYNRATKNIGTRNFSILDIKVKYPVLFDIAIYMSSILSNKLVIDISEDEIAFLALHIGTFLENQKNADQKIKAIIVTPKYLQQEEKIISEVVRNFQDEINIIGVYSDLNEVDLIKIKSELIITTFKLTEILKNKVFLSTSKLINIKEFISKQDISKIRQSLEEIYHDRYVVFLQEQIPRMIPADFYFIFKDKLNQEALTNLLSDTFIMKDYVDKTYRSKLNEREELSPTSFPSRIAIPHTIKYDSKKTGIIIVKLLKSTLWGENEVQLVMALSVNNKDTSMFNKVFPRIIEVVAEEYNVNLLWSTTNREEFIDKLINLMTADNYYFS